MSKHTTRKSSYQAKLETLRRKQVRKMKRGEYNPSAFKMGIDRLTDREDFTLDKYLEEMFD